MKNFIIGLLALSSFTSFAAPRKCVIPKIEIKLDSSHEITRAITKHESKNEERKVKLKNLKISKICEEDENGLQEIELEYSYKVIDEMSCTAEVDIKNETVVKVRSLCEV